MENSSGLADTVSPLRILVADDDPAMRKWLRFSLEGAGYDVTEAANGRIATDFLKRGGVNLCVIDLLMPEQEGIETIRIIHREHPSLEIIAISGDFNSNLLVAAKLLGARATLQKPFRLETLLETVTQVLSNREKPAPRQVSLSPGPEVEAL